MAKISYKFLKEDDFKLIKTLQEHGLRQADIMRVTKRGAGTVHIIMGCKTFDEYKERRGNLAKSYANNKKAAENKEVLTNDVTSDEVVNKSNQDIVNALLLINNTLQQLVDCWNAEPKKKGLFK